MRLALRGATLVRNLTPARVASLAPHVMNFAAEQIAGFAPVGSFDAHRDYGHLIPTITMCVLMDLPPQDREQFLKWNLDTPSCRARFS
jgi:cytochrome P450